MSTSDSDDHFDFANLKNVLLSSVKASKKEKKQRFTKSADKKLENDKLTLARRISFSSDDGGESSYENRTKFLDEDTNLEPSSCDATGISNEIDQDTCSGDDRTKFLEEDFDASNSEESAEPSKETKENVFNGEESDEPLSEKDYDDSDYFIDDDDNLDETHSSNLLDESRVNTKIHLNDSSDDEWNEALERGKLILSSKKKKPRTKTDETSTLRIRGDNTPIRYESKTRSPSRSDKTHHLQRKLGITFPLDQALPKNFFSSTCNKHLTSLFQSADVQLFDGKLNSVTVSWSGRLTSSAGIFHGKRSSGEAYINLSYKILAREPAIHTIETLLHEMIHAYLFVTGNRDRSSHGPNFRRKMKEINEKTGFNVTVTHSYHEAVNALQTYVWRCDGVCRSQAAFNYGFVKRPVNRPPNQGTKFYSRHQLLCGGQYVQITSGEQYEFALSCIK